LLLCQHVVPVRKKNEELVVKTGYDKSAFISAKNMQNKNYAGLTPGASGDSCVG